MRVWPLLALLCMMCAGRAQKFSALTFLRVDQDKECNMECAGAPRKPLCASDGRTFTSSCKFLRAKCRDPQLEVSQGPCNGQVTSHASAIPGVPKHTGGVPVRSL
ncbi:SPARC-related modular calcium-binding protein 2-like [Girardinichthys multiradiatus]|uniref:SPARC-related modular calcium-binding protein 2-like n=1 Tax=Girardinichthys multiradiatus TaxID=208333 RepID=UPI001FABFF18|nr:SPARC-related modular calcium-binding protein 2-like [Girardinichthys multiradiatus]